MMFLTVGPCAVLVQYGYRMSKAALNCAGATLARDLKDDGIPVALIHPGAVQVCLLTMVPCMLAVCWGSLLLELQHMHVADMHATP